MGDLRADLERLIELEAEELKARELEVATGKEDLETMRNRTKTNRLWFAGHRGPKWLRRAIEAEELVDELLDLLMRVAYQECSYKDDDGQTMFDSMGIGSRADVLDILIAHGKLEYVSGAMRRIIAKPKEQLDNG